MTTFFKPLIKRLTAFGFVTILASCGGGDPEPEKNTATIESDAAIMLDAQQLPIQTLVPTPQSADQNINSNKVYSARLLNSVGYFTHPNPELSTQTFTGNITVAIKAENEDGIGQVSLKINDSNDILTLCTNDCGTDYYAMLTGINPHLHGQSSGDLQLSLFVQGLEDIADITESDVPNGTVNVIWQPKVITGVAASADELTDTVTVNWNENESVLRYNVYVANQTGVTGENYLELAGGDAKLSVDGTSVVIDNKPIENTYFIRVSGIDGTGESTFSDEIVLAGGTRTTPPVAAADSFSVNEDSVLSGNVMANDAIALDSPATADTTPVIAPSNGVVVLNTDGSFTYTPNTNFNGTDQFTYQITNAIGLASEAPVTIEVVAVNDAPVAFDDIMILADEPFLFAAPGIIQNDTDIDGDELTVTLDATLLPQFGAVQLFSDGSFEYTPGENFVNYDRFGYQLEDSSGAITTGVVEVRTADFNGYPPITVNDTYQVNEDELLIVTSDSAITQNDFDEDSTESQWQITLLNTTQNGALLLADDGTFRYQPDSNFFGTDTFQYQLTDELNNSTSATVTLNVTGQNDSPIALSDNYKITNDTSNAIHVSYGVLANDTDIDSDTLTVVLDSVTQPSFGVLQMAQDGSFTYTSNTDFVGTDSFSYQISDGNLLSSIATVMVDVVSVIASTDDLTTIEILLSDISEQLPNNATLTSAIPQNGSVTFVSNTLTYVPTFGFGGVDTIKLEFTFEESTFFIDLNVRVTLTNRAPTIVSDASFNVDENTVVSTLIATIEVEDESDQSPTFSFASDSTVFAIDSQTGQITNLTPLNFESVGSYLLTVIVEDPFQLTAEQQITISVLDVAETPIITSDGTVEIFEHTAESAGFYTPVVTDDDGDSVFSFALVNGADAFAINSETGALSVLMPELLDFETAPTHTVTIQVTDESGLSSDFDLIVSLSDINEAPQITEQNQLLDELLESENSTEITPFITLVAIDVDVDDVMTWSLSGAEQFVIDESDGTISIVASAEFDYESIDEITLTAVVTDNAGESDMIDIIIPVVNVNEAPIAADDIAEVVNYSSVTISVLDNDTDPENDEMSLISASANSGVIELTDDNTIVYTPNFDITTDQISYTISDTEGLEATAIIDVTVTPLALSGSHDINLDETFDLNVTFDVDTNLWTFTAEAHVDSFFEVIDSKYYPIEKNEDDTASHNITADQGEHVFGLVISGDLHYVSVPLLDADAALEIQFAGETLTTELNESELAGDYIVGLATYSGANIYQRLAVNTVDVEGASLTFTLVDGENTGSYSSERQTESFTWSITGSDIDVAVTDLETNTEYLTVEELLGLAVISQGTYDTYVSENSDYETPVEISITNQNITLSIVDNQHIYLDVVETQSSLYQLPSSLGGTSVEYAEESKSYRLYRQLTLGTYAYTSLSGDFALPIFELIEDEYQLSATNVNFSSDGTGSVLDTEQGFTWTVNSNFELIVQMPDNATYTFAKITDNDIASEVWVSATTDDGDMSAISYFIEDQDISAIDVAALVMDNTIIASKSFTQPDSFDGSGLLQTDHYSTFLFDNIQAEDAPEGMTLSTSVALDYDTSLIQYWASNVTSEDIELVQYYDIYSGAMNCDPELSSTCVEMVTIDYEVKGYDESNGYLWVFETVMLVDFDSLYSDDSEPVYTTLGKNLDYFAIKPTSNPVDDSASVDEEAVLSNISPLDNDLNTDSNSGELRLIYALAAEGLTSFSDNLIEYAGNPDFNGDDSIQYFILDEQNNLGTATVNVTVNPVNDAPTAYADSISLDESDSITFNPTDNDLDIDGDTISVTSFDQGTNGSITQNSDGTLTYSHDGSETTTDSINYTATDGSVSVTSTIDFVINPVNDDPVANDDTASVNESGTVTIDVLTNDTDAESDSADLFVEVDIQPTFGAITVNSDNTIEYVHNGEESTSDTFEYKISDGELGATATVTLTITPINDVPEANDDTGSVVNYESANFDVLVNDIDADGDSLAVASATAMYGNVVIEADQTLTYTPVDNTTEDTITYTITDGEAASTEASVTVSVTPQPLVGSHDINADASNDFTVVEVDEKSEWQFTLENVEVFFKIENDKYYAFERETDGSYDVALPYANDDVKLGMVINDTLHIVDLLDLSSSAYISADRVGTALPLNFDSQPASFDFIQSFSVSKNSLEQDGIGVYPRIPSGANYHFESSGYTGTLTDIAGQITFTWTASDDAISLLINNAASEDVDMYPATLLEYGLITQSEYDDFISDYDESQITTVSSLFIAQDLLITANTGLYFEADVSSTIQYTLATTSSFAGAVIEITSESQTNRLYDRSTLGSYELSDVSDQTWYFPRFEVVNDSDSRVHRAAQFNSDGSTGSITELSLNIDWSINSDSQLMIDLDLGSEYENFTITALSDEAEQRIVLVEATHTDDGSSYSTLSYLVKDVAQTSADITSFVEDEKLLSSFAVAVPSSYDENNLLLIDNIFGFGFSSNLASNVPEDEKQAYRHSFGVDYVNETSWTWSEDSGVIAITTYYSANDGTYVNCDPGSDSACTILRQRSWDVLSIDTTEGILWVLESEEYVETLPWDNDGEATFYQLISPRINHYYINDALQLNYDTATTDEETLITEIDVLSNDLNSIGETGSLRILSATAENGSISHDGSTIDYTPNTDFYGVDSVLVAIADEYNQYDLSVLDITVTDVNDAPTITSTAPTDATEGYTYGYQMTVSDTDDSDYGTDFTWSVDQGPSGMTIDTNGYVTWTPTNGETTSGEVILSVIDGGENGVAAVTETFTITVASNPYIDDVTFTDSVMQTCFSNIYDTSATRVLEISYISCDNVATLADLTQFTNLGQLDLSNATDWTELANLNLTGFSAYSSTDLPDWSLLSANENLTSLTLYGFTLGDWSFLSAFDLTYLNVDYSDFNDLNDVSHMTSLSTLLLDGNNEGLDWSLLSNYSFSNLSVSNSDFTDLSLIAHMTDLTRLIASGTSISDWSTLSNFDLNTFGAENSTFSDLTLLQDMTDMAWLELSNSAVTDFSTLSNFSLYLLLAENTSLTDSELALLSNSYSTIYELNITGTNVTDLSPLSLMTELNSLHADLALLDTNDLTTVIAANTELTSLDDNSVNIHDAEDYDSNGTFDYLEDADQDGLPDSLDNDDDGDGVIDASDAFPNDASETTDTDGDGTGDNSDDDIDGDGFLNAYDFFPYDSSENSDIDEDGIGDNIDVDADDDGTLNTTDAYPLDGEFTTSIDLASYVEYSGYEVTSAFTTGSSYWYEQTEQFSAGSSAIRSGAINPNQYTVVYTTIDGGDDGGLLTFDWKVSSEEDYDLFQFYVDGDLIASISGEQDWAEYQYVMAEGTHYAEWIYYKDEADTYAGDDAAWLDNLNTSLYVVNDSPVLDESTFDYGTATITENNATVFNVDASDEEGDTLTYSITGTDAALFTINASTGELTFNSTPNHESPSDGDADNVYEINIVVTDDNGDPAYTDAAVTITVSDELETPVITSSSTVTIDENVTSVLTVTATDDDSADNLTYSIANTAFDDGLFTIDANSGVVTFNSAPDFDSPSDYDYDNIYELDIVVTDDSASMLAANQSIFVTVENVNEAPSISTSAEVYTDENQSTVVDVDATDEDTSDTLTYSLSGTDSSLLSIDTSTGVVSFLTEPNFESAIDDAADGTYEFSVTVTDDGDGALTDTLTLSVTINDVNEAAEFSTTDTINLDENLSTIMTVAATDPESDTITFSKTGNGADDEYFSINSTSGELTFSASPNFEGLDDANSDNIYEVEIEILEAGGSLTTNQTISVTIADVIENTELVLDATFGSMSTGVQSFNTYAESYSEYLVDAVQDTTGSKYLALMSHDSTKIIVSKLESNGIYDVTFGFNGVKVIDPNNLQDLNVSSFEDSPTAFEVTSINVDSLGQVYLTGSQTVGSDTEAIVIRLEAEGQLDTTFNVDGKYVLNDTFTPSTAVDVLIHSLGTEIFVLAQSEKSVGGNAYSVVIESLTSAAGAYSAGILDSTTTYVPIGLAENTSQNVVEVRNNLIDGEIMVSEFDTSLVVQNSENLVISSLQTGCLPALTVDEATTVFQPDAGTLLIGGSSDCLTQYEDDALIVRLDADSLSLDTSFEGDGISVIDIDGTGDDSPIISLSQDLSGNIAFITKTAFGGGDAYGLTLNQVDDTGITNALDSILGAFELTQDSGADSSNVHAVVLQHTFDVTETLSIISSLDSSTSSGGEEIETYFVDFDPTVDTDLSATITNDSLVYDFSSVDSDSIDSALVSSDYQIYTMSSRDNEQGAGSIGFSINKHDLASGDMVETFINDNHLGLIQQDADAFSSIDNTGIKLIELSSGEIISVYAYQDYELNDYSIKLQGYDSNGNKSELVIATTTETDSTVAFTEFSHFDSYYSSSTEELIVYGSIIDNTEEALDSFIVKYDVSDPENIVQVYSLVLDVFGELNDDYFSGAIILDDDANGMGNVIVMGAGYHEGGMYDDIFFMNIGDNGTINTSFDADADNNDALEFPVATSSYLNGSKLVKLSDDSIIFVVNDADGYSLIGKLLHSGSGIYTEDTSFDHNMETNGSSDSDSLVFIDTTGITSSGSAAQTFINDVVTDYNDNVYLSGGMFGNSIYGFVAKFNGLTALFDTTFGASTQAGMFVPAGRADCDNATASAEVDVCDIGIFEKINIDPEGNVFVHGVGSGPEGSDNTIILKFNQLVDDTLSAYSVYYNPG